MYNVNILQKLSIYKSFFFFFLMFNLPVIPLLINDSIFDFENQEYENLHQRNQKVLHQRNHK